MEHLLQLARSDQRRAIPAKMGPMSGKFGCGSTKFSPHSTERGPKLAKCCPDSAESGRYHFDFRPQMLGIGQLWSDFGQTWPAFDQIGPGVDQVWASSSECGWSSAKCVPESSKFSRFRLPNLKYGPASGNCWRCWPNLDHPRSTLTTHLGSVSRNWPGFGRNVSKLVWSRPEVGPNRAQL